MSLQVLEHAAETRAPTTAVQLARIRAEAIRAYDIRGLAGRDVDPTGAYALGLSYASAARAVGAVRVGVGRDGRLSSPSLEQALVWGLMDGGLRVERVGLCPTPMLGFAVRELGLEGAVMVTASHNPPSANGFKISLGAGRVHGSALKALVAGPCERRACGSARRVSVLERYVDALAQAAEGMAPLRVAWDCGHGATGPVVERLVRRLPGEHIVINATVDGRFPAHHPDPAEAANLSQLAEAVTQRRCDLGVAFDGDGDRIGVVDANGRILWADQLLLLLAREVLDAQPGATVVADVKCSTALLEGVTAAGGRAVTSASGHVHLRDAIAREGAALGGELSGHIFCGEGWGDDALYAALRVFQAVSRYPGGLSTFREGLAPSFATPELRIACLDERRAAVVAEVAARLGVAFDPTIGLRVQRPQGWWLLRASGTEPVLSARCEGVNHEALDAMRAELRAELALSGVRSPV